MAEPTKETPLQTVYRLTVVAGVLVCGSMAALHYGPEAGDLADMIDQTAAMVVEPTEGDATPGGAIEADPAELFAEVPVESAPTVEAPPRFDDQVLPASGLLAEPQASPPANVPATSDFDRLERERLTAPLLAAGAERADVHPWGDTGNRMYRATASAPVGAPEARLLREFDAIAATPEAAVAAVRSQLRTTALR